MIFIDLEKVFNRTPRDLVINYESNTCNRQGALAPFLVLVRVHKVSYLSPLFFNIVLITFNIKQELPQRVLFADNVGLASEKVVKLQEVFDKMKNILD